MKSLNTSRYRYQLFHSKGHQISTFSSLHLGNMLVCIRGALQTERWDHPIESEQKYIAIYLLRDKMDEFNERIICWKIRGTPQNE